MSHSEYESIYSPETVAIEAGEQALVLRQTEHASEVQAWNVEFERRKTAVQRTHREVEEDKEASRREQAQNWADQDALGSEIAIVQHEYDVMRRDKAALEQRKKEHQNREHERRRNRSPSLAFIEDEFATLSPVDVVNKLSDRSQRTKKHAMDNISFCINGNKEVAPSFVRFGASEIASVLLPKLEELVSPIVPSMGPLDYVKQFSEEIVSSPPMTHALAMGGQCPRLAEYLVQENELVSQLAISSFRQMIRSESAIVKIAYGALSSIVDRIPIPNSPSGPFHPSITFFEEISPIIVGDCFNNGLWSTVSPLVAHKIESIRRVVLPMIVHEAQHSDRVRHGLVTARTLSLLEQHYESPQPPPDTVEFFRGLLPLVAHKMCLQINEVLWLVRRLSDPNEKINTAAIEAFRISSRTDPNVHNVFVTADLLHRLDNPPTRASPAITKLLCELLPVLAIPHASRKSCPRIMGFLDHADAAVASACLAGCKKIVDSIPAHREELYLELSKINFSKESTLKLCDYAMPVFFKDRAALGDLSKISSFLFDSERRVRAAVHPVWRDILLDAPEARSKINLDDIFNLCDSTYEDCVVLGAQLLPIMALEIANAGVGPTRRLVSLSSHPRSELRQALWRSIRIISESGDINCDVLRASDAFNIFKQGLADLPDGVENAHKILGHLAPFLANSRDDCHRLLHLLDVPQLHSAALAALASIAYRNINYRKILRDSILECLDLASDTLIKYSAQAIQEWVGVDLAQLKDFKTLFKLVSHRDMRIQNAALSSLKQNIQNEKYHESLEEAGLVSVIRSLSNVDNTEAISFVEFSLRSLPVTLARNGHVDEILLLLTNEVPKIREGASTAIEIIASGLKSDRKHLLDADILEILAGGDDSLNQTALKLSTRIIPKLVFDYVGAKRAEFILSLVDHRQEPIHRAAINSVTAIVSGTKVERRHLQDALLPLLGSASASLLDVAQKCLEQALARDLVSELDYKQIFNILEIENPRIRAPVISELARYIHTSTEPVRRDLVDAGILKQMLYTCTIVRTKEDLLAFTADCLLPVLGPSFIRNDGGGASVIPLLKHEEPRIRAAAAIAIRNGVESPYGSLKNMADARIVANLHSTMDDEAVRDLWCYVVPKIAPFISNRDEIEILFDGLFDPRDIVRRVASESISLMARTSNETRLRLFPALLARLDGPPDAVVEHVALAVSLSGFAFASNGKEAELLHLIRREPKMVAAAVDAIVHLLSEGGSLEHQKLMEAGVFIVALELYESRSQRKLSLKLLYSIIRHVTRSIILDIELAKTLLCLFDDPDTPLSRTLYESVAKLAGDPQVSLNLAQLLPILLEVDRPRKPFVSRLLCDLAPNVLSQLLRLERVDIVVKLLMVEVTTIAIAYLRETNKKLPNATNKEKNSLVDESQFLTVLGSRLESRDITLRRVSSEIIVVLSEGSHPRATRLVENGIGYSLARISVNGGKDAQASLDASLALFSAAPECAEMLATDSLPAVCSILEDTYHSTEVYMSALRFLKEIAQRASNMIISESRIIQSVINWMSPRHNVLDAQCRQIIFEICQLIAQNSDDGRKALIDKNILPVLLDLAADNTASNVVNACNILKALAHTGTYRSALMSAGVKDAMERFTSPFHKSKLNNKEDKQRAQGAAKQVLSVLKSTRSSPGSPIASNISRTSNTGRETPPQSPSLVTDSGIRRESHLRRSVSESTAYTDHYPTSVPDGEAGPVHVTSPASLNSLNSSNTNIGDTMSQQHLSGRDNHLRRSVSESNIGLGMPVAREVGTRRRPHSTLIDRRMSTDPGGVEVSRMGHLSALWEEDDGERR